MQPDHVFYVVASRYTLQRSANVTWTKTLSYQKAKAGGPSTPVQPAA